MSASSIILLFEIQFFDDCRVALGEVFFEVIDMGLAVSNHAEQTTAGVVVLFVFFEMERQLVDALGQNGDLDLRRASVLGMNTSIFDYFDFLACG